MKVVRAGSIPPKLIKTGDLIAELLTLAIICSLRQGIFPDNVKITFAVSLNKGKSSKCGILN